MAGTPSNESGTESVRELFPELSHDQVEEAEENLRRYVAHAVRVYDRLLNDPGAYARFQALKGALTLGDGDSTMGGKGRIPPDQRDSFEVT